MRILLWSSVFPPSVGGMQRFAETMAGWLARSGHEVVVGTESPGDGDERRPYRVLRRPSTVAAEIARADVVHVNGLAPWIIGAAADGGRRPVVTHQMHLLVCPVGTAWSPKGPCDRGPTPGPCEVCPGGERAGRIAFGLQRAAAARSVGVAVSRSLAERNGMLPCPVIYNPLDDRTFAVGDSGEEDALVVFAGRAVPEKGLTRLMEAMRVVDARLVVVSAGDQRAVGAVADAQGVADRVELAGELALDGVLHHYARATVVCVPSLWDEPFGYATAEAMAMGKVVVATPTGAAPELLADGRGVVAATTEARDLASALHRALGMGAGERAAMAERAKAFALKHLSLDRIGRQYVDVYESVESAALAT